MDEKLARKLELSLTPFEPPIPASTLNNQVFAFITHQAPVKLVTSGNHNELLSFFTFPSPDTPLILGYPWLQRHNPHIDWAGKKITSWSLFCLVNCLRSAVPPASAERIPALSQAPDLSSIPPEYHDLQQVFNKDKALSLSHLTDRMTAPLTYSRELRCPPADCTTCLVPRENRWRTTSKSRWQQEKSDRLPPPSPRASSSWERRTGHSMHRLPRFERHHCKE